MSSVQTFYSIPDVTDPIKQGDIFKNIPLVFFDPRTLIKVEREKGSPFVSSTWLREMGRDEISVVVPVEPVLGIVASQDCDTQHREYVALFLVDKCHEVIGKDPPQKEEKQKKWWIDRIVTDARCDQRWFYLPPASNVGFDEKMAANFSVVIPVLTEFLSENLSALRIGRLNQEADEHFREQIAQYYRRYPYDEWYPLSKEEYELYIAEKRRDQTETPPRDWQK